ncbi:uncharacterized protein BX664DRAFT_384169 [Halteromyces radiatus]|uniref:uncharacterized protein n=1 Tax=Halteromyces radiatus TaxID=101107 RepID=UPI002220E9D3|nr:uncharacterized protein BX664DRAFT_384169 [Halteromyces radiatus]KAI8092625.1 hypothetical protein BX664DRAFT_384169 [Halteromyces radiatus]
MTEDPPSPIPLFDKDTNVNHSSKILLSSPSHLSVETFTEQPSTTMNLSTDIKPSTTTTSPVYSNIPYISNNDTVLEPPSFNFLPFTLEKQPPDDQYYALLSNLSEQFIYWIKIVSGSRKLFCTDEYPFSFTGEEAVHIIRSLVSEGYKDKFYRHIARTLMNLQPPLFEPLPYSERSLKKNTFYDTSKEFYTLNESTLGLGRDGLAQGIYYPLSRCYTPRCTGNDACYSPCCPHRTGPKKQQQQQQKTSNTSSSSSSSSSLKIQSDIHRAISLTSSLASSHDTALSRAWSAMIPRDILQNTPEIEVKRQEAIHELIYTEEDYVRDLNLLDELFAKPLTTAQCIEPERRSDFCENVFGNYLELIELHRGLYKDLRDYQGLCQARGGFIGRIGNIFLQHVSRFEAIYLKYGPNVVLADYNVKKEAGGNILFQNFIREKEKQAETRKLPFRHFLVLPVTRLQRYSLLLDAVYKRTPDDHPDKKDLSTVTSILLNVVTQMDRQAAESKRRLRLLQVHDQLQFKQPSNNNGVQSQQSSYQTVDDLQLLVPERQLIYEGTVTRRSQLMESITLHLFLFDHMLIMTKPKRSNKQSSSNVFSSSPPPPLPSHGDISGGFSLAPLSMINPSTDYCSYTISKSPIPLNLLYIQGCEGFVLGDYSTTTISSSSSSDHPISESGNNAPSSPLPSMRFKSNNNGASPTHLTLRHLGRHGDDYVIYTDSSQQQLAWKTHIIQAKAQWEKNHLKNQVFEIQCLTDHTFGSDLSAGKVITTAPFVSSSGKHMVVLSTAHGLWMGSMDGTIPYQQIMALQNITQIDVMQDCHILLVLADKTLMAYALEYLDPSTKKKGHIAQKVSQHVQFFSCGISAGRSLLVTMKRKGMDSHFKAYEPYCGDLRDPKNQKFLNKTGFLGKAQSWFRLYKPFYIGAEASAIQLLKARLAIVCERGFEIIDLDALHDIRNLPDTVNDRDFDFLAEAGSTMTGKPLAMFKCPDGFLLCYQGFFFLVDYKGSYYRNRYDKIEWVGHPHAVAFYHPYIVAFDSQLIEIRHIGTGELVQVLAGTDIQSLCMSPALHGVMAHPYDSGHQYVFELVPKSS